MIKFEKFTLDNGLTVIVHEDKSTALACMNILYNVGARDEDPEKTGFAHLFEHLMFGGSENIPVYDEPLERVGGENNAFTTNDITNYYLSIPPENLETGFWLESDRMLGLAFSEKSLDVQRNVVVEEFKQRYLNQPYGDVWLLLRPLAYKIHPYRWDTIGKEISHIENATMQDVKTFFNTFYNPANAILVVAGNVHAEEVKKLSQKWFEPIPGGKRYLRNLPAEPEQREFRMLEVERDVPADALYLAYHMCSRFDPAYYAADLMSDILSRGNSARLYNELVKKKKLFSDLKAYISGDFDKGLFIVSGKLTSGVDLKDATLAVEREIQKLADKPVDADELTKVKNKMESTLIFGETDVLAKATNLAIFELYGGAGMVNQEIEKYQAVTTDDIQKQARYIFRKENCSALFYHSSGGSSASGKIYQDKQEQETN